MIDYLKREDQLEPGSDLVMIEGKIERHIFENVNFHPLEQQKLRELKLALTQIPPLLLPRDWQDSDYMRILSYCDYSIDETIKILIQHLNWKKTINLNSSPTNILNGGALYINGYDKRFRPVLIINLSVALQFTLKQFQQAFDFIISLLIRDVLISNFIESIILLVEDNVFISQQKKCQENFFEFLQKAEQHFYGRFHKIYILEEKEQSQHSQLLRIFKPQTQDKIIFLPQTQFSRLTNQIDPKYLEIKFQGNQQNITTNFWPPFNHKKYEEKNFLSEGYLEGSQLSQNLKSKLCQESSYSQLILQVCNEEQEIILSESHLIEIQDSVLQSDYNHDFHQKQDSNCIQSQNLGPFTDVTPPQSTTIKGLSQKLQDWDKSSDIQFNSELSYTIQKKPCCDTQTCQLV